MHKMYTSYVHCGLCTYNLVGEIEALVHMELEFKIQELIYKMGSAYDLFLFFGIWTFYDSFLGTFQKLTYIHIQDHCTHAFINEALELKYCIAAFLLRGTTRLPLHCFKVDGIKD